MNKTPIFAASIFMGILAAALNWGGQDSFQTRLNPEGGLGIVRHPAPLDLRSLQSGKLKELPVFDLASQNPFQVDLRSLDVSSWDLTGRSHRWLDRAINRYKETDSLWEYDQMLFPIVQGSTFADLRRESAEKASASHMAGIAIGGLSVGEPAEEMYRIIEVVNEILPEEKPRYLMGVGTPANILEGIERGIDMFDCVMPTRNGRNGMIFTWEGTINIRNKKWENDFSPLDPICPSLVSRSYSRAYLRHLIIAGEILGAQIASIQNLSFYLDLVNVARKKIEEGDFIKWKNSIIKKLSGRL